MNKVKTFATYLLLGLVGLVILTACGTATVEQSITASQLQLDDYAETDLPTVSSFEVEQLNYLATNGLRLNNNGDAPILGEVGKLSVRQSRRNYWHTYELNNSYTNPVVVMNPLSFNGKFPATIRVKNVTSNSFQFKIDEWLYQNGRHKKETVSFIVAEAGSHTLANGAGGTLQIEVGTLITDENFAAASYDTAFSDIPVVLTQTQSRNGSDPVVTRVRNVSTTGFEAKLKEEEARGNHKDEVIGYMAFSTGAGTVENVAEDSVSQTPFEVGLTPEVVNRNWYQKEFENSYSNPIFLAAIQTHNGGNTANLRYKNLKNNKVKIRIQEEQSMDDETWHRQEAVGYVVMEAATNLIGNDSDGGNENSAPTALDDSFTISADAGSTFIDVLDNDSDPNGDAIELIGTYNNPLSLVGGQLFFDPTGITDPTYIFSYTISDGPEQSTANVTITIEPVTPTAPNQPTDVTVVAGFWTMTVNWVDASSNETGFNIYRADSDISAPQVNQLRTAQTTDFVLVGTVDANTTQFVDTTADINTEYFYSVSAFNNAGESSQTGTDIQTPVSPSNRAPTAADDTVSTGNDVGRVFIEGVLDNDSDADLASGDFLEIVDVTAPECISNCGFLDVAALTGPSQTQFLGFTSFNDETIFYDINDFFFYLAPGELAEVSFDYTARDLNGAEDTATVRVTIFGTNVDPNEF